jgi:hypothetical protein
MALCGSAPSLHGGGSDSLKAGARPSLSGTAETANEAALFHTEAPSGAACSLGATAGVAPATGEDCPCGSRDAWSVEVLALTDMDGSGFGDKRCSENICSLPYPLVHVQASLKWAVQSLNVAHVVEPSGSC